MNAPLLYEYSDFASPDETMAQYHRRTHPRQSSRLALLCALPLDLAREIPARRRARRYLAAERGVVA